MLKEKDTNCWAAFGPAGGKYRQTSHQTIAVNASGVLVFVNAELKPAAERIRKAIKHSFYELREALADLHKAEPFDLVLRERVPRRPRIFHDEPKLRLHSSLLVDEAVGGMAWMTFAETFIRLPLPYLRIERFIPASRLLACSDGAHAVKLIVDLLLKNHRVVEVLNG